MHLLLKRKMAEHDLNQNQTTKDGIVQPDDYHQAQSGPGNPSLGQIPKRYQLLELMTEGWGQIDDEANNMTREQCDAKIQDYIGNGVPPNRLKVVRVS